MLMPNVSATNAWSAQNIDTVRAWAVQIDRMVASLALASPDDWPGPPTFRAATIFARRSARQEFGPNLDMARRWGHEIEAIIEAVTPSYFSLTLTKVARNVFTTGTVLADVIVWATEIQSHLEYLTPGHAILGGQYAGYAVDFLTRRTALRENDYGPIVYSTIEDDFTFTRATTANYVGSNGLLQSASSGALRYGFDPTTLLPRGLLLESASTNLITRSQDLDTDWFVGGASISANAVAAPDGTTTADKIVEDGSSGEHAAVSPNATIAANTVHTASAYVKTAGRSRVRAIYAASGYTSIIFCDFDLSNNTIIAGPTVVGSSTNASARISAGPNGYSRIEIRGTIDASSTTAFMQLTLVNSSLTTVYAGDGSSGIYAWGVQLEALREATSYIATAGSTASRNAEIMTKLLSGIPWSATQGSMFVSGQRRSLVASTFPTPMTLHDGSNDNRIQIFYNGNSNDIRGAIFAATVQGVATSYLTPVVDDQIYKAAQAWQGNADFAGCANGGTIDADSSYTVPTVTTLQISSNFAAAATTHFNGHIRRIALWPRRLTNAELQAVTV